MKLLFTSVALCLSQFFYSQDYPIDQKIENYPHSFDNPEKLALLINKDFSNQTDKARAIYAWISKNVKYDLEILKSNASGKAFHYKTEQERLAKERKFKNDISLVALKDNKLFVTVMHLCMKTFVILAELNALR